MKKYYSNQKNYYRIKEDDILKLFEIEKEEKSYLEDSLKKIFYPLNKGDNTETIDNFYFISEFEYENLKKKIEESLDEYYDNTNERINKGEKPIIVKSSEQTKTLEKFIPLLEKFDEKQNISYEDTDLIDIRFFKNKKEISEKLNLGLEVEYEKFENLNSEDMDLIKKMENNRFFQNLKKYKTHVTPVKCESLDKNNNSFLIELQDTELIISKNEAIELLEKYKDFEVESNNNGIFIDLSIDDEPKKAKTLRNPFKEEIDVDIDSPNSSSNSNNPPLPQEIPVDLDDNNDLPPLPNESSVSSKEITPEEKINNEESIIKEEKKEKLIDIVKECCGYIKNKETISHGKFSLQDISHEDSSKDFEISLPINKINGDKILLNLATEEGYDSISIETNNKEKYNIPINKENVVDMLKIFVDTENIEEIKNTLEKETKNEKISKEKTTINPKEKLEECIEYLNNNLQIKTSETFVEPISSGIARIATCSTEKGNDIKIYFSENENYILIKNKEKDKFEKINVTMDEVLNKLKDIVTEYEKEETIKEKEAISKEESLEQRTSSQEQIEKEIKMQTQSETKEKNINKINNINNIEQQHTLEELEKNSKLLGWNLEINKDDGSISMNKGKITSGFKINEDGTLTGTILQRNLEGSELFSEKNTSVETLINAINNNFEETKQKDNLSQIYLESYNIAKMLEKYTDNVKEVKHRRYDSLQNQIINRTLQIEKYNGDIAFFEIPNTEGKCTINLNANDIETKTEINPENIPILIREFSIKKEFSNINNINETIKILSLPKECKELFEDNGYKVNITMDNRAYKINLEINKGDEFGIISYDEKTKTFSGTIDKYLKDDEINEVLNISNCKMEDIIEQLTLKEITTEDEKEELNLKDLTQIFKESGYIIDLERENGVLDIYNDSITGSLEIKNGKIIGNIEKDGEIICKGYNLTLEEINKNLPEEYSIKINTVQQEIEKNASKEEIDTSNSKETISVTPELSSCNIETYANIFKENGYVVDMERKNGVLDIYNDNLTGTFELKDGKFFGSIEEDGITIYESKNISIEELKAGIENNFQTKNSLDKQEEIVVETPEDKKDHEIDKYNITEKEKTLKMLKEFCKDSGWILKEDEYISKDNLFYNPNAKYIAIRKDNMTAGFEIHEDGTITGAVMEKDAKGTILFSGKNIQIDNLMDAIDDNFKKTRTKDKLSDIYQECCNLANKELRELKDFSKTFDNSRYAFLQNQTINRNIYLESDNGELTLKIPDELGICTAEFKNSEQTIKKEINPEIAAGLVKEFIEKDNYKDLIEYITTGQISETKEQSIDSPLKKCENIFKSYGFKTSLDERTIDVEKDNFKGRIFYDKENDKYFAAISNLKTGEFTMIEKDASLEKIETACEKCFEKEKNISIIESKKQVEEIQEKITKGILLFKEYGFEVTMKDEQLQIDKGNMFGNLNIDTEGKITCEISQLERGLCKEIYKSENKDFDKVKENLDEIFDSVKDAGEDKGEELD